MALFLPACFWHRLPRPLRKECTMPLRAEDPLLTTDIDIPAVAAERQARGVLRARDQAVLASELAGRITEMPFAEGQHFRKDEVLVRFDCGAYQAQLNAVQAAARAAREELAHKKQLAALNSVGRFEVNLAEARRAQAEAEAQVYRVQVKRCSVTARLGGGGVKRRVQPHERVAGGTPIREGVDTRTRDGRPSGDTFM